MKRLPFINSLLLAALICIAATGAPIGEGSASGYTLNYSTTEQDTGATWTDGKTIYSKTVDFGALPNSTSKSVAHGITTVDTMVRYDIIANAATDDWYNLNFASSQNPRCFVEEPNIKCVTSSNYSSYTAKFLLFYTKQ